MAIIELLEYTIKGRDVAVRKSVSWSHTAQFMGMTFHFYYMYLQDLSALVHGLYLIY